MPSSEEGDGVPEDVTRKPWPRAWTRALVLAVGLFGAHATSRRWLPALMRRLFGQVPDTFAETSPPTGAPLVVWVVVPAVGGTVIGRLVTEGRSVRDRHRWQRERTQRRQRWGRERQIREERTSEAWRQWHQRYRQRQAEITPEARRRSGPAEEGDES
jgi:hypothetical protein